MESGAYKVLWTTYARVTLARMHEYKVNPMTVFRRSKAIIIPRLKLMVSLISQALNLTAIIGH